MRLKGRFGRKPKGLSDAAIADVLDKIEQQKSAMSAQKEGLRGKILAVKSLVASGGEKSTEEPKPEVPVDANMLDTLVGIIQDTMQGQHDAGDARWPRKLQWPSHRYMRASWIYVWEQLQPDIPFYMAGAAKIPSANAGHVACLGPCLLQAAVPVHTLIVHGDLEYCTLLGHRLHIDLAVYFAALRTLAQFLKGQLFSSKPAQHT